MDFKRRLKKHADELRWLYMELYNNNARYEELIAQMERFAAERDSDLKKLDCAREKDPQWYQKGDMLGMTMYSDLYAGGLRGVMENLDYLSEQKLTYLHLMPLLKMPEGENDGGYAVEDFRQVDPRIGTNEELRELTRELRRRGISLCLDFIVNHSADTHEWAKRARAGEQEYIDRYMCFDSYEIPSQFEKTMPEVFPGTAPGNFTYIEEMKKYVLTTFHKYQWDLNYRNPVVFNEMVGSILYLANLGVEVFRIDAVPYIWKQLGTSCRNLPQVHTVMRMIRMITEIVCPAVILKGEVVMAPREVAAYFGTPEKPECHILYNVSAMVNLWAALACRDTRLLKRQLDDIHSIPNGYFINYIRCHDDIGWGLDEDVVRQLGFNPLENKIFLYRFYQGHYPGSFACGELYNFDPQTLDARSCGTSASLCGVEQGLLEKDEAAVQRGIDRVLLMHACMMTLRGFPMIYSGDEIGQLNDNGYHSDVLRREDSRNLHRGKFQWDKAALRHQEGTIQQRIFEGLRRIEELRAAEPASETGSWVTTWDTFNQGVLCLVRRCEKSEMVCFFNFTEYDQIAHTNCLVGDYTDLFTGEMHQVNEIHLKPYQYMWCRRAL